MSDIEERLSHVEKAVRDLDERVDGLEAKLRSQNEERAGSVPDFDETDFGCVLFVGGPADGRRIADPSDAEYDWLDESGSGSAWYRRERIMVGREEVEFYAWEKLGHAEALRQLLRGYPSTKQSQ